MKSIIKLLFVMALAVGFSGEANTGNKVLIHHNGHIVSVSESAVDAHLDHGDEVHDDGDDCTGCDPV
jgi:hypothetical protein